MKKNKQTKIKHAAGDRLLQLITTFLLIVILIVVAYPVIYVVSCSFSSAEALSTGRVLLWPVEPTLAGYEFVMQFQQVWLGYRNTVFYTVATVVINMVMTVLCAYPLSRPSFRARKYYMTYFFITMMVGAGLIPTFIIRANVLNLYDSVWAILLGGAMSVSNMIIVRTAFQSGIPQELFDAACIDGANDFQCLIKIAIPLAKATLSVVTLYYAVGVWNDYFTAMIYLETETKFPLALFLRSILTAGEQISADDVVDTTMLEKLKEGTQQIKYALIVMSTIPVLVLYAFVQKYFEKGVMIGSVKG